MHSFGAWMALNPHNQVKSNLVILCDKMHVYGIHQTIADRTRSFLLNRTFKVRIAAPVPTCNGVPQGSVLGPKLFLIFVNELPDVLSSNVLLFADDVKLISAR